MVLPVHTRDWGRALLIAIGTAALILIAALVAETILRRQVIQESAAAKLEALGRDTQLISKRLAGRINDLYFLKSLGEREGVSTSSDNPRGQESFQRVLEAFMAASSFYSGAALLDETGKVSLQVFNDPNRKATSEDSDWMARLRTAVTAQTLQIGPDDVYISDVEEFSSAGNPEGILVHLIAPLDSREGGSQGLILLSYHLNILLREIGAVGAQGDFKALFSGTEGWWTISREGGEWTTTRQWPSGLPPQIAALRLEGGTSQWIEDHGDVYCIRSLEPIDSESSHQTPKLRIANPQRLQWKIMAKIPKAAISSAIRDKQSGIWLVSVVAVMLLVPASFVATLAFLRWAHVKDQIDKVFKSSMHGIIALEACRKADGQLQGFRVVRSNSAGAQLLKPGGKEVIDALVPWLKEVAARGVASSRELELEQEGTTRWFNLRAAQLEDGAVVSFAEVTRRKQDEEALRSSESSLRLAARMSKVGGWSLTMPERTLYWSPEVRRIHAVAENYQPDLENALSFYPPASRQKVVKAVEACETEGRSYDFETDFCDSTGRALWVRSIGEPEYDPETGTLTRIVGTFQDVTESREAALALTESRERLAVAFWGAGMGLADWRAETDEVVGEEHWAASLGYLPHEIGKSPGFWKSLIPEEDLLAIQRAKNSYFDGGTDLFEAEYRMRAKDGSFRWVLVRARISDLNKAGRPGRMSGVLVDITARKTMEGKLAEALENEKELTRASQAAEKAKRNFLAMMSHEIRTPMNSIIGFADVLLDGNLPDEEREHTRTIKESGEALLRIINDILDYSRIESGRLQLEKAPFSLRETIDSVVVLLSRMANAKEIALTSEISKKIPSQLVGDAGRLSQILMNLVGNAIKFTRKGTVTLVVEPVAEHSLIKHLRFRVIDTGIGIPADKLESIFEPFTQADASISRSHGGTGLGLAISNLLVKLLGGTLKATSVPGTGSEFSFELPFATRIGTPTPSRSTPLLPDKTFAATHPLSILVAEDDKVNARLTRMILEKLGYHPDLVADGQAALESCHSKHYDLVLMDLHMPRMDGIEATKEIRNIPRPAPHKTRIVAFTADVLPEERQACMAAGMDDYLTKPLAHPKLCEVLRQSALLLGKTAKS